MNRRTFIEAMGSGIGAGVFAPSVTTWLPSSTSVTEPLKGETDRLAWWRDARFGMFIHFGLYSTLGGEWKGKETGSHEWIRNNAKIPHEEYIQLVESFNPTQLDADAWVRAAKEAGQKYIVITTKHHEGFALWNSAATTYDVMSTPYKRDIMRQVAAACRRHGMRLGWYYSIMDWYHPDYLPRRDWEQRDATNADFSRYVAFMRAQLRELLTQYGDISIVWFDGQWENTWNHSLGSSLYDYVRSLAPNAFINNRVDSKVEGGSDTSLGRGQAGDFGTPELEVPERGLPGVDWETCMTMNHNWGYSKFDHDFKSAPQLVGLLAETASKGGNLLLNVGPMGDGRFPHESVDALRRIGEWMVVNGDAIYASRATPFAHSPFRATLQPRRLNLFVDRWTTNDVLLPGLRTLPRAATILGAPSARVTLGEVADGIVVRLPERAPSVVLPVVRLDFTTEPRVDGA